ncbi:MAG: LysM peptidoglycan-binding domain-containing protein, partial [Lactococcus lactis]|nr:LysM peptidoglycan-binding domain-containing protein [Lactococcus lactis]
NPTAIQKLVDKQLGGSKSSGSKTYTVKSGDTLSGIGQKLGVNWKTLASKNGLSSPYTLYPGQKLNYGSGSGSSGNKTYTVKSGDTLSGIGSKLGINWKTIANLNGLSKPYTLYPGQKLKYKGGSGGGSKTYTVKSGDTLSGIGAKLGIKWTTLANKNGLKKPYTLYPGQKIKY